MGITDAVMAAHDADTGVWGNATIDELFRRTAETDPARRALGDAANRQAVTGQAPRAFTYGELDAAVERLARHFVKSGLMPGDVVAAQLPNTAEQIVVLLAASRCGITVSPLPLMWREYELSRALPRIAPKALISATHVVGRNHAEAMCLAAVDTISVRFVLAFGDGPPDGVEPLDWIFGTDADTAEDVEFAQASADRTLTICWAGGSHMTPSPVPRSHRHWVAGGLMTLLEGNIRQGAAILCPYPLTGLVPIGVFFIPWLLNGGTLLLHHPFDLNCFIDQLRTGDVAFTGLPPSVIDVLHAERAFDGADGLSAIGCLWPSPYLPATAGSSNPDLLAAIIDILGFDEMAYFARKRLTGEKPGLIPHGECRAPAGSSSGPALMTTRVRGGPMNNGHATSLLAGDLMIKSAMMFDAYYPSAAPGADEPTLERDAHDFVNTGLRCRFVGSSKPYIDCTRRENSVIYHGGISISALELDGLYSEHEAVADAAAFTFEDPVMGDRIVAVIVPNPGLSVSLTDFVRWLNGRKVAAYKIPDRIVLAKSIPRGSDGEVLRDRALDEI